MKSTVFLVIIAIFFVAIVVVAQEGEDNTPVEKGEILSVAERSQALHYTSRFMYEADR